MRLDYTKLDRVQWFILDNYMNNKTNYFLAKYGKYNLPPEIENMKVSENLIGILHHIEIGNTRIKGLNE